MKNTLSIITVLFGVLWCALPLATARTLYTEDWGNTNATVQVGNVAGSLNLLGWTAVLQGTGAGGPYCGIYGNGGANDPQLGTLTGNNVYFTSISGPFATSGPAMFYTTSASNAPAYGNIFTNLDTTVLTNLTLNSEINVSSAGGTFTNYFAVQVGGSWWVATNNPFPNAFAGYTNFTMLYTNLASVWNTLTIDPSGTFVTIGGTAGGNLVGSITGIGIVALTNAAGGGLNYNRIIVNQGLQDFPTSAATNSAGAVTPQTVFAGGGTTFSPTFSGTPTITFRWQTNGVNIGTAANIASGTGSHYLGASTTRLTITNASLADATLGITNFSVTAVNFYGSATNIGLTLNVIAVPPYDLYVEWFPPIGSTGPATFPGIGWTTATRTGSTFGFFANAGNGGAGEACYNYSPNPATNAFYATITSDNGLSGLPFPSINPANYPAVTIQCAFAPGNGAGGVAGAITAYWAVQMSDPVAGTNWYSSASPIPIILTGGYQTNQMGFTNAAANWNNLGISGQVVTFGSQAASPLTGNITGAGFIFVFNDTSGSDMNWENFAIITNAATILPPVIGNDYPIDLGVPSGGGASFGVAATTGTQPFGYYWKTNTVLVQNGGRVSGATTATLTIANLNANDSGMQIVAFVTNSAGFDESDSGTAYGQATTLTVTNPPVGLLYSEAVPFVGPVSGNYPISSIGWAEAVPGTPFTVFRSGTAQTISQGQGAVFAFLGNAGTTVYYTTTATDTNQAGLPFPNINLGYYSGLNPTFSVDIAPNSASSTNVTAYLAVQLNGANWYVAQSPLLGPNATSNSVYSTYTMSFRSTAWANLTVTPGTGGTIGSTAPGGGILSGVMTGAGLVFVYVGSGGTFNFDNFQITGTGIGGVNASPPSGGKVNLTWVGNPAINLQSTTNLTVQNWLDVPGTLGLYSFPVSVNNPPVQFFRLVQH